MSAADFTIQLKTILVARITLKHDNDTEFQHTLDFRTEWDIDSKSKWTNFHQKKKEKRKINNQKRENEFISLYLKFK